MKICEQCDKEFVPKGRQKVCKECKNGVQEVSEQEKEARPTRPIERFRTNWVQPGCVGVRRVAR